MRPNVNFSKEGSSQVRDLIAPDKRVGKLVSIEDIQPNPNQPRKHFDEEALQALAKSISEHGLINPITVDKDGMILAGERRYRCCKMLGMKEVPVLRMNGSMEISLVENLQRQDLHPLEEAMGYQALVDAGSTHEQIAQRIGKDRSVVSHSLRLLELPHDIHAECVTSHNVTKDQLLQVLAGETEEEQWEIWNAIKAGKSARALKRERTQSRTRTPSFTPRVFLNRVKDLNSNIQHVELGKVTDKQRQALRQEVSAAVKSLQTLLDSLD